MASGGYSMRKAQLLLKAILTVMAGEYWVGREGVSDGARDDADEAGIAVKKPKSPNLNSGSTAASPDEGFG
jgi:hypothetical protein